MVTVSNLWYNTIPKNINTAIIKKIIENFFFCHQFVLLSLWKLFLLNKAFRHLIIERAQQGVYTVK